MNVKQIKKTIIDYIDDMNYENATLKAENRSIEAENEALKKKIDELNKLVDGLRQDVQDAISGILF